MTHRALAQEGPISVEGISRYPLSSAPKTPTQGACSITIERGRRLALGAALSLAGFAPSTTGRFSGVHRGEGASFRHRSAVADSEAGLRHRTAQGCSSLVHYGSST